MKKHGRTILKKLRSKAGESISETLISLLIAALALVMLAGAITSAATMITKSKTKLGEYYAENEKLAVIAPTASPAPSSGTITITQPSGADMLSNQSVPVLYAENSEFGNKTVTAYIYDKAGS